MRPTGPRLWLLAFAAYFLMIAAWAFAAPYDGSADERDHIYRAAGVYAGDIAPAPADAVRGSGAFVHVPRGLIREDRCWQFKPQVSADCAAGPGSDRTTVRVGTGAGRYHPGYYALVGLPLKLWPGWSGVLLARLVSGAAAAALLAGAVVAIATYSRRRFMVAGLLVAVTPMALHFFAAVNPNGLEIAAGVGLFAAMIPLTAGRVVGVPRGLLVLAGSSGVALASLRPTGLIYLSAAAVAFLLPPRRETLSRLWASVALRWWAGAVALAAVVAVGYTVAFKGTDLGNAFRPGVRFERGQVAVLTVQLWGDWANQLVGVFSWLDTFMPDTVYLIWHFAAGGLLVSGIAFGHLVDRWRLLAVLGGAVGVPTFMQFWFANETGFVTQGRYMLPALAGVMLLAAWILDERDIPDRAGRSLARVLLISVLPIHLFAMLWTMTRWRSGLLEYGKIGLTSLDPFAGGWHPVTGSALPLLLLVLGGAGLAWLVWRGLSVGDPAAAGAATAEVPQHGDDQSAVTEPATELASRP
jgi:hypothetical protein